MISVELPVNPACLSVRVWTGNCLCDNTHIYYFIFIIYLIVQVTHIIMQKMWNVNMPKLLISFFPREGHIEALQ